MDIELCLVYILLLLLNPRQLDQADTIDDLHMTFYELSNALPQIHMNSQRFAY